MPDQPKEGIYEAMREAIYGLEPLYIEFIRLLPDGVVFGTMLLTLLSMCKSYGMLLLAMVELMLIQRVFASAVGGISPMGAGQNVNASICQPGFTFPNTMRISLLETIGKPSLFPSPTVYFVAGIITYMIGSIQEFKREITVLGGDLGVRTTVAIVLSSLFMFVVFAFRHSYGCESFGTLLISILLGAITGGIIMYQNKLLFGRDSINLMNLPMIVSAAEMGKPMFVCAPSQ